MRPRVFPAEDVKMRPRGLSTQSGFNEAAGIPRGRHQEMGSTPLLLIARFNEAAGIPRGRLMMPSLDA